MLSLADTVGTLNLLGDESRLRLCALLHERELSVTDLVRATGISQPRVSTHLARLRDGGFVRDRRAGQNAFYTLSASTLPAAARAVLDEAASSADATLAGDRLRLAQLDAERLGALPASFAGEMDRHYSPGRTWESLALAFAALLQLGDVLDAGSGDGAVASFLAASCRSLTCVDTSEPMIAAARERLARHDHVRALCADVEALPFPAASFDTALMLHTLTYASRPHRAVAECVRVLRPGGRLVVLSLDAHEETRLTASFGERHAGFSPRQLRAWLEGAGLRVGTCAVVCREPKKPHFRVVLATGEAPSSPPPKKPRRPRS